MQLAALVNLKYAKHSSQVWSALIDCHYAGICDYPDCTRDWEQMRDTVLGRYKDGIDEYEAFQKNLEWMDSGYAIHSIISYAEGWKVDLYSYLDGDEIAHGVGLASISRLLRDDYSLDASYLQSLVPRLAQFGFSGAVFTLQVGYTPNDELVGVECIALNDYLLLVFVEAFSENPLAQSLLQACHGGKLEEMVVHSVNQRLSQ